MNEKKLTDEEIVKALENCAKELNGCDKCPVKEQCCDLQHKAEVLERALELALFGLSCVDCKVYDLCNSKGTCKELFIQQAEKELSDDV